jgi:hypothetical protein
MTTFNFGNVGDLTKPATVLIEKIFHAAGVLWEPKQMVSIAQAEAKADMIRAIGELKVEAIKELAERTGKRFVYEELRKQYNMESIIGKAIPAIEESAKPQDVEDDWIANFFDKCRLISDKQMQELWAKILAGEANGPGRFSKKTLNIVASLDKSDAEAFTKLCGYAVSVLDRPRPLVYDQNDSIYTWNRIDLFTLSNLDSMGLVRFNPAGGFVQGTTLLIPSDTAGGFVQRDCGHKLPAFYYGQTIWLELPQKEKPALRLGKVILTEPGLELASICDAHPVDGFVDYLKEKWKEFGYKIEP